ncbi:MAG: hypothetical protein OEM98_17015 [Gammaproteobacteria bacterium]|nr:hypothetical protein [Gammaproteobacteria bacterium]
MRISCPMALEYSTDRGSRHLRTSASILECPRDSIRPIFAKHASLAQLGSSLQNVLLAAVLDTIPGATGLMIGKQTPIQPLSRTARNPKRHRAHINPKLSGYCTHTLSRTHSPNHLSTLTFNGAFLAMTNSPQSPLRYRNCWTNAEHQVLDER